MPEFVLEGFALELQQSAQIYFAKIINSAFVQRIADGSLPSSSHLRFLAQDHTYLTDYYAAISCLSPRVDHKYGEIFKRAEEDTLAEKNSIGERLQAAGISLDLAQDEVWKNYGSYLRTCTEHNSVPASVGGIFLCFISFYEMACYFKTLTISDDHPYREWISLYTAEQFSDGVQRMMQVVNEYAALGGQAREEMKKAFLMSASYEAQLFSEAVSSVPLFWRASGERSGLLDAACLPASEASGDMRRSASRLSAGS